MSGGGRQVVEDGDKGRKEDGEGEGGGQRQPAVPPGWPAVHGQQDEGWQQVQLPLHRQRPQVTEALCTQQTRSGIKARTHRYFARHTCRFPSLPPRPLTLHGRAGVQLYLTA